MCICSSALLASLRAAVVAVDPGEDSWMVEEGVGDGVRALWGEACGGAIAPPVGWVRVGDGVDRLVAPVWGIFLLGFGDFWIVRRRS